MPRPVVPSLCRHVALARPIERHATQYQCGVVGEPQVSRRDAELLARIV
jgi:hypothetical protein